MEDPTAIRTRDFSSRVWWTTAGPWRVNDVVEVALQQLMSAFCMEEIEAEESTHHTPWIAYGSSLAIAIDVCAAEPNLEMDAGCGPGFAVVCACVVRLSRPELETLAGPGAEIVKGVPEGGVV